MSAFNLSSLAAMQDEHLEQASTHFWRCQLTAENPRHAWDPSGSGGKAKANGDEKIPSAEDKKDNNDDEDDDDDDVTVRHLLQVTGCVLPPQASGVHLITVRTSCYQKQPQQQQKPAEPAAAACPIVCIDPLVQRTLALGHEFVPGSAGSGSTATASVPVVFELAEGTGPVWLTGTHRIHRVTRLMAPWCCDYNDDEGDGEDAEDATGDEVDEEEEAGDDADEADVEDASDAEEAGEEDEDEDEDEEEEEEEEEEKTTAKRKAKGQAAGGKMKPAAGKKKQQQDEKQQQQQQRRKRAKPDS